MGLTSSSRSRCGCPTFWLTAAISIGTKHAPMRLGAPCSSGTAMMVARGYQAHPVSGALFLCHAAFRIDLTF